MTDLVVETERLFAAITHKLNDLITYRRAHDPAFSDPDLHARQRRLERIRKRLFARWVRRGRTLRQAQEERARMTEEDYADD